MGFPLSELTDIEDQDQKDLVWIDFEEKKEEEKMEEEKVEVEAEKEEKIEEK